MNENDVSTSQAGLANHRVAPSVGVFDVFIV